MRRSDLLLNLVLPIIEKSISLSLLGDSTVFNSPSSVHAMACRNLCERFDSRFTVGEVTVVRNITEDVKGFCPCCDMAFKVSPTNKKGIERLRQ